MERASRQRCIDFRHRVVTTAADRVRELVEALESAAPPRSADDSLALDGSAQLTARIETLEAKPRGWRFIVLRDAAGFITEIRAEPAYVH